MPGFVDVSNMTSEEVRRMGHADDYDEEPQRYGFRKTSHPVHQVGYSVSDVWAAACAAHRVNGEYRKETKPIADPENPGRVLSVQLRNRDVMLEFLQNPDRLTVGDVETGEELRRWLNNDLTFRALKSQLTEFDSAAQKCLAVKDKFYSVGHRYELAVIAALPNSFFRAKTRETVQDRLAETTGKYISNIGDKIKLDIEVIQTVFSKNWNVNFVTAITPDNHAVFFSYRPELSNGSKHTVIGTVKSHKDGKTQLNRVSII
jgi:hypothetical protein